MQPLLTMMTGLIVGVIGIRAVKSLRGPERLQSMTAKGSNRARAGFQSGRDGLRRATAAGLDTVSKASGDLSRKVEGAGKGGPPREAAESDTHEHGEGA